jgi:hypothetical protein
MLKDGWTDKVILIGALQCFKCAYIGKRKKERNKKQTKRNGWL